MDIRKIRIALIISLFLVSLGGFLLHLRIHPIQEPRNLIPFISGLLSLSVVIIMFCFKKTASYAYLITGMTVIVGTIIMAHFSISRFQLPVTISKIFLNTLLADISILFAKFGLAKAIYESYFIVKEYSSDIKK